jgi:hypothetical protein
MVPSVDREKNGCADAATHRAALSAAFLRFQEADGQIGSAEAWNHGCADGHVADSVGRCIDWGPEPAADFPTAQRIRGRFDSSAGVTGVAIFLLHRGGIHFAFAVRGNWFRAKQ